MKKLTKILLAIFTTLALLLIFYFFFPHIWGEAVWPLYYPDTVKKYSLQYDIDPNLIEAFIYTESRGNVNSVSGAGAVGLMQIMPGTGASIAEGMGDTSFSPSKLHDADYNIHEGTFYLKELMNRYNNNVDLVAVAYNAGTGTADRYQSSGGTLSYGVSSYSAKIKNIQAVYNKVYGNWWSTPEVKKPSPFYQGVNNIGTFVHNLILGQ